MTGPKRIQSAPPYLVVLLLLFISCGDNRSEPRPPGERSAVPSISGVDGFKSVIDTAGDRLLVFDFHADWCHPCKLLVPIFRELAEKFKDDASFYRVDVDQNPDIAASMGIRGIPFVLFVKEGRTVHSLTGLQPKESYIRVIEQF